jgi:hypothetical protein
MSPTDCFGVPWHALTARVEPADTLARWARAEPALAGFGCLDDVATMLHHGDDVERGDQALGAVVRLAAVDGGDEEDAALLVAHLLANGSRKLALKLRDLSDNIDDLIAEALWLRIRMFPWRQRSHAYAKSLLLDTRKAVLAELHPYRSPDGRDRIVPVDPLPNPAGAVGPGVLAVLDQPMWEEHDRSDIRLADVLDWAQRSGIVTASDVELLIDLAVSAARLGQREGEVRRGANTAAEVGEVARRRGVNKRTIWRHRTRALVALRGARDQYLAAVA